MSNTKCVKCYSVELGSVCVCVLARLDNVLWIKGGNVLVDRALVLLKHTCIVPDTIQTVGERRFEIFFCFDN